MGSLKVPGGGLLLAGPGSEPGLSPQAFHVRLNNSVVEAMIQSARNGDDIRLSLGKAPTLRFGAKSHRVSPSVDLPNYDLYLTKPFESTRRAELIPTTTSLFQKPPQVAESRPATIEKAADSKAKPAASSKGSASSGLDSDLEALQNGLAAHSAARGRAGVVGKLPGTKKTSAKAKAHPILNYGSKLNSLPTSPGLAGARSPSLMNVAPSASQQAMERAKEQRVTLVHELAVKDQTIDRLKQKWEGKQSEFRTTLEKVAEYNSEMDKWTLRKAYWKELDAWSYDYESQEERQKSIDNAIRHYDRQRLSAYEPEWQKLLPKEERGKGKCLSRLQANLAKGPQPAPKIKVQKAEDGSTSSGDALDSDKPNVGGEKMLRSASNPLPVKPKKLGGQEAQAKRLLGNSKAKPTNQKPSPTKNKGATAKASGGRVLSQEIIVNSDTSGDEAPAAKPKPAPKIKDTVVVARRPPVTAPAKLPPAKRPREDDGLSSSSGTPLSKRIKPSKQPLPAPKLKHRPSDASLNSRGASSSLKSKNTSPTKSSPLASSPPTNASDLEHDAPQPKKLKRKTETEPRPAAVNKRRAVENISMEILRKANRFKTYYQRYEALHHEISALDNPPDEKLADLLDMRGRLESMKREIYRECSPARD